MELWLPVFQASLLNYFVDAKLKDALKLTKRKRQAAQIAKASAHLLSLLRELEIDDRQLIETNLGEHIYAYGLQRERAGDELWGGTSHEARLAMFTTLRSLESLQQVADRVSTTKIPSGRKVDENLAMFGFRLWEALRTCGLKDSAAVDSKMAQAFEVIFSAGCIDRNVPEFLKALRSWRKTTAKYGALPWVFTGSPRGL